jgi:hypothetical protein
MGAHIYGFMYNHKAAAAIYVMKAFSSYGFIFLRKNFPHICMRARP